MSRALTLVLVALALVSLPRKAGACKCKGDNEVTVRTPMWRGPIPEGWPGIMLVRESVEVVCEQPSRTQLWCRWSSVHVYALPEPRVEVSGLIVAPPGRPGAVEVRVDGVAQPGRPMAEADCWLPGLDGPNGCDEYGVPADVVYEVHPDPSRDEVEVAISTTVDFDEIGQFCSCLMTVGEVRHRVIGGPFSVGRLTLRRPLDMVFAEGVETEVRVEVPRAWRTTRTVDWDNPDDPADQPFSGVAVTNDPVEHGPLLAGGVGFGDRGFGVRPQLRAGYEVFGDFLGGSLAVESDLREQVSLVPLVELASPAALFVPSFGGGVGVPVMLVPEARPGFRLQLTISWIVVSVIGVFDVYPGGSGWAQALRGAVLVQLSI
jgi:hypothetical protein